MVSLAQNDQRGFYFYYFFYNFLAPESGDQLHGDFNWLNRSTKFQIHFAIECIPHTTVSGKSRWKVIPIFFGRKKGFGLSHHFQDFQPHRQKHFPKYDRGRYFRLVSLSRPPRDYAVITKPSFNSLSWSGA